MIDNELQKRILSSIILLPVTFFFIFKGSIFFIFFLSLIFLAVTYEWFNMSKNNELIRIFGIIFSFFSFFIAFYLRENSFNFFLLIIVVCIFTDIGGYIFGKVFKGLKLTKISPNKTYSGMIGGYFLSLIFLSFFIWLFDQTMSVKWFIITILISTVSQIGDITISYFKRLSKIKDTGKIIPGHGGLLDRIDGMIFAFPIFYLIELTDYLL